MRVQGNNDLCTPLEILELVRKFGTISLDPCSNPWSQVQAEVELTRDSTPCGLSADWSALASEDPWSVVFVNPPYGRGQMDLWAKKISGEAAKGLQILALVKGDFSTRWWHRLWGSAVAVAMLRERVRFGGGAHSAGTFPSALFFCGDYDRSFPRFRRVFSEIANVVETGNGGRR